MRIHLLILAAALCSIGPLKADNLAYTVTPTAGQYLYEFTLQNTGSTGGTLYDLYLSLQTDIANIDTGTIGTPVGWGDPTGGLLFYGPDVSPSTAFLEWSADFSGTYDIGIGDSLGGFSFLSSQLIDQPVAFALNGTTAFASAQEVFSAPEPSAFVLLLTVLLAIGFGLRGYPTKIG